MPGTGWAGANHVLATRVRTYPVTALIITSGMSRRAALNRIANENAAASVATTSTSAGSVAACITRGAQSSALTICAPATLPNVSLKRVTIAPAKRAVPVTSWPVASSVTAVVSVSPGISTISAAMTTVWIDSGATK